MSHHDHTEEHEHSFSLWLFVIIVVSSLALVFAVLRLVAPHIWHSERASSATVLLNTFLIAHLCNAYVEYFFHRYVLHAPLIPFLKTLYKKHTRHHALTHVVYRPSKTQPEEGIVENVFPILEEKQHESSFFPWYSFLAFAAISTLVYIPIHLVFPDIPIFTMGYLSVAWSLALYEILHAIQHWSLEKWSPLLESKRFGWLWKILYGFHLRHHADIKSNESISGFFGIPIPDFTFRTWVNPKTMYKHKEPGTRSQFIPPRPVFLIRWLDVLAEKSKKPSRKPAQV